MRFSTWTFSTAALCFTLACVGCGPAPFRIGLVAGLSGSNADLGESGKNGALLAVEAANRRGALGGRPIELDVRDDTNRPAVVRQAAAELGALPVDVIVGPFTSAMTSAVLTDAPANVLFCSPTASSSEFSRRDDQLVRLCASTADNARAYADFAVGHRGYRTLALLRDTQNGSYTRTWGQGFSVGVEGLGAQVVLDLEFDSQGSIGAEALARRLLAAHPEAVVLVTDTVDVARLTVQLRRLDPKVPILACDWAGTDRLIELGGWAVDGVETLQPYDGAGTQPAFITFVEEYRRRFGTAPNFAGVMAYETVTVLLTAESQRTKDQTLKQALLAGSPYQGLQQPIRIDSWGDARRATSFVRVVGGRFEPAP